jgi:ferrous-iron efflux pump FieF
MMIRVAIAAVAVAALLVVMKTVAYIVTDSIAMMASLADSALDVFASFVNLLAIRHALTPADREHRFGHGKAEPLAGLGQGAFIAGSAAFLVIESVSRLIAPHPIEYPLVGLGVMGVSIILTVFLVVAQRIVVLRTGSIAVGADSMHYVGDIVTNGGVILGIIASSQLGILIADPIIGILVAAILSWSAVHVFRQSYDQLMDRELPDAERDRIKEIVRRHRDVKSLHDLRTRAAGVHTFIQLHIELDPDIKLVKAHEISDEVEADLLAAFPHAEVIIHQDPAGVEMPMPLAAT